MEATNPAKLGMMEFFLELSDPRMDRCKLHSLNDILVLAICAVIAGAESWEDIEDFADCKQDWFRTFLDLPNGIPSHDTFSRLFARLDPDAFGKCFIAWFQSATRHLQGSEPTIIALDGKTLRRSFDKGRSKSPLHMVNAWSSAFGLALGQMAVEDKSNEITAVPKLLDLLNVSGCIVTADALLTQREISERVLQQKGDYVLALKGNQAKIYEEVRSMFDGKQYDVLTRSVQDYVKTVDADHGRVETRHYWVSSDMDRLEEFSWPGLKSIGIAETQFEYTDGKTTQERRYFLTSLPPNARLLSKAIRSHWGIEAMHWTLDVTFREDASRIRKDHGPQNFAVLRQIAHNLLKSTKVKRLSVRAKRKMAGWDNSFLIKVLLGNPLESTQFPSES